MIDLSPDMQLKMSASSDTPLELAIYLADQNPHRDRSLGITSMTRDLMQQLMRRDDVRMRQITSRSSFAFPPNSVETHQIPLRTDRVLGRLVSDAFHTWLYHPDVDVWYYPKGYAPRFTSKKRPVAGTMHDTIIQHWADHYPETRSRASFRYWVGLTRRSLEFFDLVMTVSNHAADQLRRFCQRHRIAPPPIAVTYEGSSWETFRQLRFKKKDRVVHLASRLPHKKTVDIIKSWRELLKKGRDLPQLVLVGELSREALSLASEINAEKRPRLSLEDLRDLIGSSLATLLPSEIEGFGLPALESYYVSTPTCFVRHTAVDEILSDAVESTEPLQGAFDLDDTTDFESALDSVLSLSDHQVRQVSDLLFERYSLQNVSNRVVDSLLDLHSDGVKD